MRTTVTLVPAALLTLSFIGCTDSEKNTPPPASTAPDSSSTQPANQERAVTGGQPTPTTTTPGSPAYDRSTQPTTDRTALDREATDRRDRDLDAADAPRDADNTTRNTRDREGTQPTPLDQGSSDTDLAITQAIRKAVVDADDISVNAQNVKIITLNGVVTLRGPVANASERTMIATIAERTAGVTRVDDQLEIAR